MKINILKSSVLTLGAILFLTSCLKNDEVNTVSEVSEIEIQNMILADDISASIDNILDDDDFSLLGKGVDTNKSSVASCVIRTFVEDGDTVTITLDFGDSCTGYYGLEFSGNIVIEYTRTDAGYKKEVAFEGFTVDGNSINGTKSVVKVRENINGNREATHNVNLTFTFTTGETVSLIGTRIREMIEGADTVNRGDDAYSISGNWEYVNRNGVIITGDIVENLRREFACRYIVSGVTEIIRNSKVYTLNFGDGSCDNKATLTDFDGNSAEVSLRR